jgi:oligosaccharide repeat unit polymerase
MLQLSYATAAMAMLGALLYLVFRLRQFLTTTTLLMMLLLLVYGPALLGYTLTSGEYAFLIGKTLGVSYGPANPTWATMAAKIDLDPVITVMNFSVILMYAGIISGIEIVGWLAPRRTKQYSAAVVDWHRHKIQDDAGDSRILLGAISALAIFMLYVSFKESHLATIKQFFAASSETGDRLELRLHHAGSANYLYNVILGAVAPMFVIWGVLAGWIRRSLPLLLAALLMLLAVLVGKIETLSKASPAFFVIQLMLAALLTQTNRITWRTASVGACALILVIYFVTHLIVETRQGLPTLEFAYSRVFEVENETLLEYFASFPHIHPFMWGTNLRPLAALLGVHYVPAFSLVAHIWHGVSDETNPSLFIADAWADFSYLGVIVYSIIAGAVCRSIDLIFLARGKSVVAIAVLAATFIGVLTLLTTALNIAFLSGGLLLAPCFAALTIQASRLLARKPGTQGSEIGH